MRILDFLRSRGPLLGLIYLVALVSGGWGFAVARYEVFPYDLIRPPYVKLRRFLAGGEGEDKPLIQKLTLHRQERMRYDELPYSEVSGLHRVDEDFVDPGYLLLSRFSKPDGQVIIELLRLRDARSLHTWVPPLDEILSRTPARDDNSNSYDGYRAQHPVLLENGSVVFMAGEGPMVRLDRESEIEWMNTRHFHHSIERDHEGNLVVPNVMDPAVRDLPLGYRDDGYAVVSPEGEILDERSMVDILLDHDHTGLLYGVGRFERDRIHLNDAQPIHRDLGEARVGDIALSIRNISTVLLYRPSTDEIVWLKTGPWQNQHDIDLLDNGSYSIFGNDMIRYRDHFVPSTGINDVYIYDPTLDAVSTPYTAAMRELAAATRTGGRSEVLDNGDVLVEINNGARLARLTNDGIRWVYQNAQTDYSIGFIHWCRYYSENELDLSWVPDQASDSVEGPTDAP
jgi:hypothetical protein